MPLVVVALTAAACGGGGSSTSSSRSSSATAPSGTPATSPTSPPSTEQQPSPAATESNPPGDIPDNQAFVTFQPPAGGFSVKVPEGWARSTAGATTSFSDKLNRIQVLAETTSAPLTSQTIGNRLVPQLQRQVPKFAMGKVSDISRAAGPVVLVTYQGDSSPDPVTGKVVRDAFELYLFHQDGRQILLTLSGPTNADNVDPWKIVSDSVRWQ
ncbi:hypothetical protein ACLQ2O_18125 [Kribbella sp. DT2]